MINSEQDHFIKLLQEHSGIIHKVIRLHVEHEEDQRDLVQEIMLQAWKSYPNFKGHSKFSTWLYKVGLNTVFSFKRRKKPVQELKADIPQIEERQSDRAESLLYIIKKLNDVDRVLMTLHLDGYKNIEIAEITGMTANHVNVKIHRLKQTIIDALKKQEDGYL